MPIKLVSLSNKIKKKIIENKVSRFYRKHERRVSTLFLLSGFVIDSFTLKRIDSLFENLWTGGLLLGAATCLILIHYVESKPGDEHNPYKSHFWFVNLLQFFFGGILSVFLIFYFRSGDFFVSWPFLALLVVAVIANESLKNHYVRLTFQASFFFLALYCFLIFILPVFVHEIGARIFVLSGLLSLLVMLVFVYIVSKVNPLDYKKSKRMLLVSVTGIFVAVNLLYFNNLIPPIPLSLKDSGVYYSISRDSSGVYLGQYKDLGWKSYFRLYDDFYMTPGVSVYAFSAVFSPTDLNTTIFHTWQHYDEVKKEWIEYSRVPLLVIGGRGGGYRTYSMKTELSSGKWRVNVENIRGQVIGRIRFNIVQSGNPIGLETKRLE